MKLRVYSLKHVLYAGDAKSLNLQAIHGELTVLDMHRPLITALKKGSLKITDSSGEVKTIEVNSGFLEIKPQSQVTILVNA